jgi:hypothetical protein
VKGASVENSEPTHITLGMTRLEAYEFVQLLATDVDFRNRLEANPLEVLADRKIWISPRDELTECIKLPPIEEVAVLLERMGEPDEMGRVSHEVLGYVLYALFTRIAFAMPLVEPDLVRDGAG